MNLWLLLIHQLPTKPAYLRVKIWRRLQDLGAFDAPNFVAVDPWALALSIAAAVAIFGSRSA